MRLKSLAAFPLIHGSGNVKVVGMECLSYCIANQINLSQLERLLRLEPQFSVNRYWQVLELKIPEESGLLYIFTNGTVVSWNIRRRRMSRYLPLLKPACVNLLPKPLYDSFFYDIADKTTIRPHEYFNVDCLTLESNDPELMLSLSYGFSQSIKLKYFEDRMDKLIEKNSLYINQLSSLGRINLSRLGMRRIIGEILAVKGELNIVSNFSYQPKFFWQHPSLEPYFGLLEKYLDIAKRKEAMNQQLDALNEIFDMFVSYLDEKHGYKLELIIIVLIAIEIMFYVLNLHL